MIVLACIAAILRLYVIRSILTDRLLSSGSRERDRLLVYVVALFIPAVLLLYDFHNLITERGSVAYIVHNACGMLATYGIDIERELTPVSVRIKHLEWIPVAPLMMHT